MILDSPRKIENIENDSKLSSGLLTHSKSKNVQGMHAKELHDLQQVTKRCSENHFEDSWKEYVTNGINHNEVLGAENKLRTS